MDSSKEIFDLRAWQEIHVHNIIFTFMVLSLRIVIVVNNWLHEEITCKYAKYFGVYLMFNNLIKYPNSKLNQHELNQMGATQKLVRLPTKSIGCYPKLK